MFPKWHILIGFSSSVLLVEFFGFTLLAAAIVFVASFMIDTDHYLYYAATKKDLNPIRAVRWNFGYSKSRGKLTKKQKAASKKHIMIFHGIETWAILLILGIFWTPIFLYILLGIGIHMAADWINFVVRKEPLYPKLSQVLVWIRNRGR